MNEHPADPQNAEKRLIWDFFGRRTSGFFVEVGAFHPYWGSQTWYLEQQGWRGILIEPIPRFCQPLRETRAGARVFQVACGAPNHPPTMAFHEAEYAPHSSLKPGQVDAETRYVAEHVVTVMTLDEVLREAGEPKVDFVSIDVEGAQLEVLRGLDFARHHPELVLVEDHLRDWQTHRHLRRNRYRLARRTDFNNWYVPEEHRFRPQGWEALKLWRKLWLGTPARKMKFWFRSKRPVPATSGRPQA